MSQLDDTRKYGTAADPSADGVSDVVAPAGQPSTVPQFPPVPTSLSHTTQPMMVVFQPQAQPDERDEKLPASIANEDFNIREENRHSLDLANLRYAKLSMSDVRPGGGDANVGSATVDYFKTRYTPSYIRDSHGDIFSNGSPYEDRLLHSLNRGFARKPYADDGTVGFARRNDVVYGAASGFLADKGEYRGLFRFVGRDLETAARLDSPDAFPTATGRQPVRRSEASQQGVEIPDVGVAGWKPYLTSGRDGSLRRGYKIPASTFPLTLPTFSGRTASK